MFDEVCYKGILGKIKDRIVYHSSEDKRLESNGHMEGKDLATDHRCKVNFRELRYSFKFLLNCLS